MEERLAELEEAIKTLAGVLQDVCEKLDWHDKMLDEMKSSDLGQRLESVEKDFGDMVGGFTDMLGERRKGRIAEMASGYEGFGPYKDRYNKVFKSDLVGDAVEWILKAMEDEGKSETDIPAIMDQIVGQLKERFDEEKAEGETPEHEAAESPAEEKAEHEEGTEGPPIEGKVLEFKAESDGLPDAVKKMAREMRGRAL